MDQISFQQAMDEPISDLLLNLPGWTSRTERQFNQWYTRTVYSRSGAIVDLGCMAGSSTLPQLAGLVQNDRGVPADCPVHAYDMFVKYWEACEGEPLEHVAEGDSFLPDFEENVSDWSDRVVIHAGDIMELGWSGSPIEYLFVDVMKSWALTKSVATDFFPALIPGKSTVVHQDYKHFYTPWIHILMYRLRDQLEPVFDIPSSESTVFRCVAKIDVEDCRRACQWSDVTVGEIDEIFTYSKTAVDPTYHASVEAIKAMLFAHLGGSTEDEAPAQAAVSTPMDRAVRTLVAIHPRWDRNVNVRESWERVRPYLEENRLRFAMPLLTRRIRAISNRVARLASSRLWSRTPQGSQARTTDSWRES